MDFIDDKRIVYTGSYLLNTDKKLIVNAVIEGWPLRIKIVYKETKDSDTALVLIPTPKGYKLQLINWDSLFGHCTSKPAFLCKHENGEDVYLMLASRRIETMNSLTVQILMK